MQPRSAIIAVAGPVKGDDIPLTNAGWVIKPRDMLTALSLEDVIIINDFEAQALAIAAIGEEGREQIGPGSILDSASCAVLGALGPALALRDLCMRSTPGFRFRAKAAMWMSVRAASAITRSGPFLSRSKDGFPLSSCCAAVAS